MGAQKIQALVYDRLCSYQYLCRSLAYNRKCRSVYGVLRIPLYVDTVYDGVRLGVLRQISEQQVYRQRDTRPLRQEGQKSDTLRADRGYFGLRGKKTSRKRRSCSAV